MPSRRWRTEERPSDYPNLSPRWPPRPRSGGRWGRQIAFGQADQPTVVQPLRVAAIKAPHKDFGKPVPRLGVGRVVGQVAHLVGVVLKVE